MVYNKVAPYPNLLGYLNPIGGLVNSFYPFNERLQIWVGGLLQLPLFA
jgi:hypothetical protein